MTMLLLHFCLLALLQVHPSHSLVSSRLKPRFQFGNTNVKPGFPSISANSHIPLGDNTNLNLNGKYNYVSNNFQGGAGFNHQSGRNNYGLGANYNSANGGVNIGANANIHNNLQAGVGYNTANHGVDAGLNWRFGRRSAPKMQRFSHPEAAVGRSFLEEDLRLLQKTVGSRHPELLKLNLSEKIDPETYSTLDLIVDLQSMQKQLGDLFPRLRFFMTRLGRKQVSPSGMKPMPAVEQPSESSEMSASDLLDLKTFAANLVYGQLSLKQMRETATTVPTEG